MKTRSPSREIDLSTWNRARHYALYAESDYPLVGFTTELDITRWDGERRRSGRKFFPAFLQHVILAMNAIENFRYRIDDGKVYLCDRTDPSFVVIDRGEDLFYFAVGQALADPAAFDRLVAEAKAEALARRFLGGEYLDVVYFSCLPWFSFSDMIQPFRLKPADSVPRVVWGRLRHRDGTVSIPFSITGHHGLFDGVHVARLLELIRGGPEVD